MARKNKKNKNNIEVQRVAPRRQYMEPEIIYARVPSGIPIAKPASNIQLTPVVQPVAFVPYSTGSQPLLVMDEYDEYDY